LECKWHSGTEADLVCLECGQPYCRECVKETREAHYCPDCHHKSVERLAAQMGGRKEVKEPKPPKVKEPKVAKEKPPKEKKEDKRLRKPAEVPLPPTLDDLAAPRPPAPEPPPPSSLSPEEKAAFWGDTKPAADDKVEPFVMTEAPPTVAPQAPPAAPPVAPPSKPAAAPPAAKPAQPMHVQGMPPPLSKADKPVAAAPLGGLPDAPPPGPPVKKRPILSKEAREEAVMTAEGFPSSRKERKARGAAVADGAEEELVPQSRIEHRRLARKESRAANLPVAMQVPEDYDGEVTNDPSYIKAALIGMGIGLVGAAAYAGLAWWIHKDLGIIGWVVGFGVGLGVVLGSGRHYSWKLGLMAALIAMFWVSAARIGYSMLDVKWNGIITLPIGTWQLFRESLTTFWNNFLSWWLAFFLISGAVAFLVAFRPPPVKLQLSSGETQRRVAGKGA